MVYKSIIIKGKVQGVFFRKYAREAADARGICGWVRNLPNGDVEIMAAGQHKAMTDFITWCHTGSPRSVVQRVTISDASPGIYLRFEILR